MVFSGSLLFILESEAFFYDCSENSSECSAKNATYNSAIVSV